MPSSVFWCISVFQVYFGVYTDRQVCYEHDYRRDVWVGTLPAVVNME